MTRTPYFSLVENMTVNHNVVSSNLTGVEKFNLFNYDVTVVVNGAHLRCADSGRTSSNLVHRNEINK